MSNSTIDPILFELQNKISISMMIIYSFFCLTGNPLVIYIMTRPYFLKISIFRFSATASFISILRLLGWIANAYRDYIGVNSSVFTCKVFYYVVYLPHDVASWIMVWTGIDRYLSVKYPKKFAFRNKTKFQVLIILIIISLNLFVFDFVSNACQVVDFKLAIFSVIETGFLSTALPGFLMIIISCMIYKRLIDNKKKIGANQKKEITLFKTLISVYTLYLICYLPYYISYVIYCFLGTNFESTITWQITQYLCAFYSAFDYFIYFFSNRIFREHSLKLFGLSRCIPKTKGKTGRIS